MAKKKLCRKCGKDITHKNFIQLYIDNEIQKFCPDCAQEVKNEKTIGVNRNMRSVNVFTR